MQGPVHHRPHAGLVRLTPAAILAVPYVEHGDTPAGWDCRGLVRHLRAELFGVDSPGMGPESYSAVDVRDRDLVERLMLERMGLWRELERFDEETGAERAARVGRLAPGAVILFSVFQRDAHVGLLLSPREFVHTIAGQGTTILRLDNARWSGRIRGAYDTRDRPSDRGRTR